jgi:hypothetical protein
LDYHELMTGPPLMRRKRIRLTLWLCALAIAFPIGALGQSSATLDNRITAVLAQMASKDLTTREIALSELLAEISEGQKVDADSLEADSILARLARFFALHPQQADRVKKALIEGLQAVNRDVFNPKTPPGTYTENDSEYHALMIQIVAGLHDERSISALIGSISTGWGAINGVVQFGDKAIGPALVVLNDVNRDPLQRSAAIDVLSEILKAKNDPAARARLMAVIRAALADHEPTVRNTAVSTIESLSGEKQFEAELPEFVAMLQDMVRRDSIPYGSGKAAQKALDRIAKH